MGAHWWQHGVIYLGDRPQHVSQPAGITEVEPLLSTLGRLPACGSGTVALQPHRGVVQEVRG